MYSEQDMKEFFQNVVDQVATLSTQASKVQGLEQRIIELSQRFDELQQRNRDLESELVNTRSQVSQLEVQVSSTNQSLENERAVTASLRETIVQRDAGVHMLEQSFRSEQDAHKITTSERDDARRHATELGEQANSFRNELEDTRRERTEWKDKYVQSQAEVNDLKQKLDRVNSILNPLRAISGDVQAVG